MRFAVGLKWIVVAGVLLFVVCGSTGVLAQARERALIDEIVRKTGAREKEEGFCARTGWPGVDSVESLTAFLRTAKAGSWKVNAFARGCELNRVTRVRAEKGGKCVTYAVWYCATGRDCMVGKNVDCLDRNGDFVERR